MGSLVSHLGPFFYALIQPIREHEPSRCTMHRPGFFVARIWGHSQCVLHGIGLVARLQAVRPKKTNSLEVL